MAARGRGRGSFSWVHLSCHVRRAGACFTALPLAFTVYWLDQQGKRWQLHDESLNHNAEWRKGCVKGAPCADPGFEIVSPPLARALVAFRLQQQLYMHTDVLGVLSPCHCGSDRRLCGDECNAYDPTKPSPRCRTERGRDQALWGPEYHVHVDGSRLCTSEASSSGCAATADCSGLVQLLLYYSQRELCIRRMFPVTGVSAAHAPIWTAAPSLIAAMARLEPGGRTCGALREIFTAHRKELGTAHCRMMKGSIGCRKAYYTPGVLYRFWSLNVAGMLNLSMSNRRTLEFRANNMARSYAMTLNLQLLRQLVHRAGDAAFSLKSLASWEPPLEWRGPLADPVANLTGYLRAMNTVTRAELLSFVDELQFPPRKRKAFLDHVKSLPFPAKWPALERAE